MAYYLRLGLYCRDGHNLLEARHEMASSLDEFYAYTFANLSIRNMDCLREQKRSLVDRLESSDPISPRSLFGLNQGLFVAFNATQITYVIVMLQFKVAELSSAWDVVYVYTS